MAIALEEVAAGMAEGSVGPLAVALGAGAVAILVASRLARPATKAAIAGGMSAAESGRAFAAARTGWLDSVRDRWRGLVAEARDEYEAGRPTGSANGSAPPRASAPRRAGGTSRPRRTRDGSRRSGRGSSNGVSGR